MSKTDESNAEALLAVNLDHLLLPELDYLMIEMIEVAQALQTDDVSPRAMNDVARQTSIRLQTLLLEKMRMTAQCVHRARQSQQEIERATQRGVLSDWTKLSG